MIDKANRECLAIEVGTSTPSARLIRVLSRLVDCYGAPDAIGLDNGPELVSQAFTGWAAAKGIIEYALDPVTRIIDSARGVIGLEAGGATGVGLQLLDATGQPVPL